MYCRRLHPARASPVANLNVLPSGVHSGWTSPFGGVGVFTIRGILVDAARLRSQGRVHKTTPYENDEPDVRVCWVRDFTRRRISDDGC